MTVLDLLVGVMTTAPPTVAYPFGVADSTLLMILDKRVSDELAPAPARTVTVVALLAYLRDASDSSRCVE